MKYLLIWLILSASAFGYLRADINQDCRVDIKDLLILFSEWLMVEDCNDMALGPELVLNGIFSSSLNWTTTGNFDIIPSNAIASFAEGASGTLYQSININSNKRYRITFDAFEGMAGFNGNLSGKIGGNTFSITTSVAGIENVIEMNAGSADTNIKFITSSFSDPDLIYIDNVSVKQILGGMNSEIYNQLWDE